MSIKIIETVICDYGDGEEASNVEVYLDGPGWASGAKPIGHADLCKVHYEGLFAHVESFLSARVKAAEPKRRGRPRKPTLLPHLQITEVEVGPEPKAKRTRKPKSASTTNGAALLPPNREVRAWADRAGIPCPPKGRIPGRVIEAWTLALHDTQSGE